MADNVPNNAQRARTAIDNYVALHMRQVPESMVERAASLLACVYDCGITHGVKAAHWQAAVGHLPSVILDAVIISGDQREGGD